MKRNSKYKFVTILILNFASFIAVFSCDSTINNDLSCRIICDTTDIIIFKSDTFINISEKFTPHFRSIFESRICDSLYSNLKLNSEIQESFDLRLNLYFLFDDKNILQEVLFIDEIATNNLNSKLKELIVNDIKRALNSFILEAGLIQDNPTLKYFKVKIGIVR